jgi:hypothetical protein
MVVCLQTVQDAVVTHRVEGFMDIKEGADEAGALGRVGQEVLTSAGHGLEQLEKEGLVVGAALR